MSVSREWNSLKAAWVILLLAFIFRVFLSSQFLLTPEEAVYWFTEQDQYTGNTDSATLLTDAVSLSTALLGNSELAVRLPSALALTIASIFLALLAASMFSWHTALHVTLISQGVLQLNLAAVTATPASLLLACWAAVCYHASQGMNDNRTSEWLFAGFWFGIGLLCKFSMILLLPSLILCFALIKQYRTCLLFPGPWLGLILSIFIFLGVNVIQGTASPSSLADRTGFLELAGNMVPDPFYSMRFLLDQFVLLTPVVLLLVLGSWIYAPGKRDLVKPDVQFLILTSCPFFILYMVFPVFSHPGNTWSATAYMTALVLIAGMYSSTRSSFKGRPHRRWKFGVASAYIVTVPLLLQIAFPSIPLPVNLSQTKMQSTGWDVLGRELDSSAQQMGDADSTFIFSLDPQLAGELAFYMPTRRRTVSLDRRNRANNAVFLETGMGLAGQNAVGVVTTRAALEQVQLLFDRVEFERELTMPSSHSPSDTRTPAYYIIRGFGFRIR